ncbi:MAG: Calx-beta domain-containing protein [Calothrix sp. MO_167.B42]|nr:Calx-beta domain-containing protein [Calothrix sp. MO_167.B42]
MNEPALLELFNRLREAGLPLGLGEYHLLLQALQGGFGTSSRNALAQLCCTLWIKSEDEKQIFQEYFDQLIPEQSAPQILPSAIKVSSLDNIQYEHKPIKKRQLFQVKRHLILGVFSSLVLIGSAFTIWLKLRPKPSPPPNPGILTFRGIIPFSNDFFVKESKEEAVIKIVRTGGSRGKVSATLIIEETDDYQSAKAGKDFDNTPIPVSFADGETEQKITISIYDDKIFEGNEKVSLCLTTRLSGVRLGKKSTSNLIIVDDDIPILSIWLQWLLIAITCLLILLITLKMRSTRRRISTSDDKTSEDYTNLPRAILSPEVIQLMADEIQVAKAIKQPDNYLGETFPMIAKDIPVTYRQIKQGWRYLRNLVREGAPTELDIEATIQQIGNQGFLLKPVLTPRRINKVELLLLIDQDGSMVPFHHLSQAIINTASQGGRFHKVRVYYFHNCPNDYLYEDPYHLEAVPVEDCLSQLPKTRVVCLIFSDAGAARGGFNSKRRRLTKFFIKELKQYVHHIAWLNPVPRQRWEYSTAGEIANLVPMFEVNRQEVYQAIDILRGHHPHLE